MKRILLMLVLAVSTMGQTAAPAGNLSPDQQNILKAKALLDQMIEALGGPAYLDIKDISQDGRTYAFHLGQPTGGGVVFWRFYQYPDKDRIELTKKRDITYIVNGDKGYEITYKGTRTQDKKEIEDAVRRRKYALDWVLRTWLKQPGVALFYDGPTVAEQKNVEKITLMNAQNEAVSLFVDSLTHLPVKKTFSWRDPTDKQRNIEDEVFDAYRSVQGIMTPFSVTRFYNGDMSNQRFLNTVTYNQSLPDSMFDPSVTYDPKNQSKR